MTRFILVASAKGGTGKTTTALNLAAAMKHFGKDVIVVDANLTTPNIALHLGASKLPTTLHDVLRGKKHITEALYLHNSNLKIIPGSISLNDLNVNPDTLRLALAALEGITDFVIIDSPAGLGREALAALNATDEVLVVTNPELPAVTDALKIIRLAQRFKKHVNGVIVTRTRNSRFELTLKNIETILEKPILGVIHEDNKFRVALNHKDILTNLFPNSTTANNYKRIASNLLGENYTEQLEEESFLYHIFRKFGLIK